MNCKNSNKTGPLPGSDPRETSWRSYSKNLIVELKEKLADRRAQTLALLSENQDLTAFKEIDTESDGLDDTSTNNTNIQEQPDKEDATPQEQSGDQNSVSEASSLTESDFHDQDSRGDEFGQYPEMSNAGHSRCCSRSCSTVTSVSERSYTSEDVSSRSLDDFVADDGVKDGHYPCPHSIDVKCSICLLEAKVQEKYLAKDNAYMQGSDIFHQQCEERNVTTALSNASLHFQHSGQMNQMSLYFLVDARLAKAKSDTYLLYSAKSSGRAHNNSHSITAGLLMTSMLTGTRTYMICPGGAKPFIDEGSFSHQELDVSPNDDSRTVEDLTNASMISQKASGNVFTVSREVDVEEGSSQLCNFLKTEDYYFLEEEIVINDPEDDEVKTGDNKGPEKVENKEEVEEKEHNEEMEEENKKDGKRKSAVMEEITEKEEEEEYEIEEEVIEKDDEEQQEFEGEKIGAAKTEETQHKELPESDNIKHSLSTEDSVDIMLEGKSMMIAQDVERPTSEDNILSNLFDSNNLEISNNIEKLQDQTYSTLSMHEAGHKSLSHLKVMLDEMIQIFDSNIDVYSAMDKTIVAMFENHSADFSMLISAYENISGNSGYAQTRKHSAGAEDDLPRQNNSARTEAAVKLNDQNRSLQACLEKARLATTLQGKLGRMRNRAENFAAVKAYEQTVTDLEKTLLGYLEVYAKEAVADNRDSQSQLTQSSSMSAESIQEDRQEKGHNVLRRSDTFVVKEPCTGKPPNIAKRRNTNATAVKGISVNPKGRDRGAVDDAETFSSEDSMKAPHSSPTFLVAENIWNIPLTLLDTTEPGQETKTNFPDGHQDLDHGLAKQQELIRSTSYHVSDHDFESDSSESLSDVKETDKLTYTSSLLAQLLDYNSADECKSPKERAQPDPEREDIKTNFDDSLLACSEFLSDHVKKRAVINAKASRNVEDNQLPRKTLAPTSPVQRMSLRQHGDEKFGTYVYRSDITVSDEDQENDTSGGLEMSHDTFLNETVNLENVSEKNHSHGSQVPKEARNVKTSMNDRSKGKDALNSSQDNEKKYTSSSVLLEPVSDSSRHEELCKMTVNIDSRVGAWTNTRDTSPLEKARPLEILDHKTTSSEASASYTKHYFLGQDRQHSHKKWKLSNVLEEDASQDLCPDKLSKIDWSSSDEEAVDDLQRDSSPSDLLKQKQKKEVEEKLQQLNQCSDRRRKSRSPLRHKASRDISNWMGIVQGFPKVDITADVSNLIGYDLDKKGTDIDSFFGSRNTSQKVHYYTSLSADTGIDKLESRCCKAQEDSEVAEFVSASQLLLARNQEKHEDFDKNNFSKRLNETTDVPELKNPRDVTICESIIAEGDKNKMYPEHFMKTSEAEYLETTPQLKCLTRYAPNSSAKPESGASESRQSVPKRSKEDHKEKCYENIDGADLGSMDVTESEVSEVHGDALFSDSSADTCIPVTSAVKKSISPECLSASSDFVLTDKSDTTFVNQGGKDIPKDDSLEVEPNNGFGGDQDMKVTENLGSHDEDRVTESTPQSYSIPLGTGNGQVVHSFSSKGQNEEKAKRGRVREGIHDFPPCDDHTGDVGTGGVCYDSGDIDSLQVNQRKAYSHLFYTHVNQTSSVIEAKEGVKAEPDKNDDYESYQSSAVGDKLNHRNMNDQQSDICRPPTKHGNKQVTASKNSVPEKKRVSRKVIHELEYQHPCPSLSTKTQCDETVGVSPVDRFLQFEQKNFKKSRNSSLQVESPSYQTSSNGLMDSHVHSQNVGNNHQDSSGLQTECQALDALRHKVNRLEQMLQNSDIIKDRLQQRKSGYLNKEALISSRTSNSCPRCQQGVPGQNLIQPCCSHGELEHMVHPCCQGHTTDRRSEQFRDVHLCPDSMSEHRSRLHGTQGTNDACMSKQAKLSTKECQTSEEWVPSNLKPDKAANVDGWTQCDRSDDATSTMCKLLEEKLAVLHQDVRDMKQFDECATKTMMELDGRISRIAEHTSTALANHSKQLENSQTFMSEEFKNVQDSLQIQNDVFGSMREYLTEVHQTSEAILQSLKPLQMDTIVRSFQTVEETLCPLRDSLLTQKNDIEEIRSNLERVVLSLEERRQEQTKKGMSNDTMKERIVELTSQRDAEKVFHRITRQSLRALERDHDRLREEYVRATCRRYNNTDSDVHNRLWYYLKNQDRCEHCCNNHNDVRDMPPSSDECSSPRSREEDGCRYHRYVSCDRPHSCSGEQRSEPNYQKKPHCCCTFVDHMNRSELVSCRHKKSQNETRDTCKPKSKRRTHMTQPATAQDSREHISLSDHVHNARKSPPSNKNVNVSCCLEADLRQMPTRKEQISDEPEHGRDETFRHNDPHTVTADTLSTKDVHISIEDPSVVCPCSTSCKNDMKETR